MPKIEADGQSWLRRPKLYKGVVEPDKKKPVLKTLKTFETLRHVSISCEIIHAGFFISFLRSLSFKKSLYTCFWYFLVAELCVVSCKETICVCLLFGVYC